MTTYSKLRGLIIGAGYFASFHIEAWSRIPEVEMLAVCDRSAAKAQEMAASHRIPRHYSDWKQAIDTEQPDFIDIITPPDSHEEICAYAARRKVNMICQKPLAEDFESSKRIVEAVGAVEVRFMVHENWRWQPWYRKIKEISQQGLIGDPTHIHVVTRLGDGWSDHPYSPRQPYFRDYPRLLIYETGVHFIDTFRFLMGEITGVHAQLFRRNSRIRGEDACILLLNFASGATAVWDASRYNETEARDPRFTFGELRIDGMHGSLTMDTESNLRMKLLGQPSEDVAYERSDQHFAGDCVYFLQRHFVECMLSGREFESNGIDYLKTIQIVEAAYEAAGMPGK
jgi:predicted dehydrogenase